MATAIAIVHSRTQKVAAAAPAGFGSPLFAFEGCTNAREDVDEIRSDRLSSQALKVLEERKKRIDWFTSPLGKFEHRLRREVKYILSRMEEDGDEPDDAVVLASKLCAMGYDPLVRKAVVGNSDAFSRFKRLRHEFLVVRGKGDWEGLEFIVETRLREHFNVLHPTAAYTDLLQSVPRLFIGSASRLLPIVQDLSNAMAESFESKGLPLPPWRRFQPMLSKWLPTKSHDTGFSPRSEAAAPSSAAAPFPARAATPGPGAKERAELQAEITLASLVATMAASHSIVPSPPASPGSAGTGSPTTPRSMLSVSLRAMPNNAPVAIGLAGPQPTAACRPSVQTTGFELQK